MMRRAGGCVVALGIAGLTAGAAGGVPRRSPAEAGQQRAPAIVLVNNQPFAIRMPMEIGGIATSPSGVIGTDSTVLQASGDKLVFIGSVGPATSHRLTLVPGTTSPQPPARLAVEAVDGGVRLSFDRQPIGQLTWAVRLLSGPGTPKPNTAIEPPDFARGFEALPLAFARAAHGPVFDTWAARGAAHGLAVALTLRAYRDGFLDLDTRVTTEPGAGGANVYAAIVSRLTYAAPPTGLRISYDSRMAPFGPAGRTPFRAGEGRHQFVQRGLDWATWHTGGGATVSWINDFAESFTTFEDSSTNRFHQPRYTGANLPQLGSEAQVSPEALFWITEIARSNIQSYRDRLIDNILPPPGESVHFASRVAFDTIAASDARATEAFLAYTGYVRQDRRGDTTELAFGVPSVRFGTAYFPYSTLGENFDRLKLPGMDSEGYWPLAADTVEKWPLFADAIRRDLRIAKAMGFHVIRLHYLDVIARLSPRIQRDYLDFLFAELRHLELGAMLSPSDARFTPAQIAAMVSRYRDVVESVEIENEILIWGIPQD
ncbi:MAG: hypothetical protein ABIQ52_05670, partial [Vicinamibacterales bacterium]